MFLFAPESRIKQVNSKSHCVLYFLCQVSPRSNRTGFGLCSMRICELRAPASSNKRDILSCSLYAVESLQVKQARHIIIVSRACSEVIDQTGGIFYCMACTLCCPSEALSVVSKSLIKCGRRLCLPLPYSLGWGV